MTENHDPAVNGPRIGTIIWGGLLVLLGIGVIGIGAGLQIDLQVALIVLLALPGAGLLIQARTARDAP